MNTELSLLDQVLAFADKRQVTLPVFSQLAQQVQAAAREDRFDMTAIERAIESDPALVAELLRQANSAFFGGLSEVASVRAAILRLGMQRVANLVVLATEKSRYTARDQRIAGLMRQLWGHASAAALAAEWIARKARHPELVETVFIGALVHDIGKLFLLRVLDGMAQEQPGDAVPMELIHEVLDQSHADIGHRLLSSWNLPEVYQVIVRDHHAEGADASNLALQIVRLADRACNHVGLGLRGSVPTALAATAECAVLGLTEVQVAELEIILEDVLAGAGRAA